MLMCPGGNKGLLEARPPSVTVAVVVTDIYKEKS